MSNEEKQIEEIKKLQDRLIKRSCTEYNTVTSMYLVEASKAIGTLLEGYRKASDVTKEILEKVSNALHDMATEYADAGRNDYYAVCEMVHHKVIRPLEKKYESEE